MSGKEEREIFIFELDGEEYSIEIGSVREIIKSDEKEITEVPNVPDFIRGITNVRGQVVPVIDLEQKFSLTHQDNNYIVIVELNDTPAGLLVDDVREVLKADEAKVQDAPNILEQEIHREYVKDVVVLEDRMIIILDLKAGLSEHEEVAVEELKDTMEEDDTEEEEEVTKQDAKRAAMDRLSEDEEEKDDGGAGSEGSGNEEEEKDTESAEGDREESSADEEDSSSDEEDSGDEFQCDECGDSFDSKRGLASHKVQVH